MIYGKHGVTQARTTQSYVGNSSQSNPGSGWQTTAEVAQWGAPSCSQPQPATDNGLRDSRSN